MILLHKITFYQLIKNEYLTFYIRPKTPIIKEISFHLIISTQLTKSKRLLLLPSEFTFVFALISSSYSEDELYFSPILVHARLILNNKSFFLIFLLFQKGFPNLCKKVLFFVTEMKISFVYAGKWEVNLKEKCPCLQKETKKYFVTLLQNTVLGMTDLAQ